MITFPNAQFVYWAYDSPGHVLYVGQHTGHHPATRVKQHADKAWWADAVGWGYAEVPGDLNAAEQDLIRRMRALHNRENAHIRAEIAAARGVKSLPKVHGINVLYARADGRNVWLRIPSPETLMRRFVFDGGRFSEPGRPVWTWDAQD